MTALGGLRFSPIEGMFKHSVYMLHCNISFVLYGKWQSYR